MKHTRQTTTLLSKALFTVISFMLGNMTVHAETIEEGFEEVTLVDAEGNALDNQWSWGYGLSNGWKIIGGTIDTGGNGSYTLVHGTGKGAIYTDYYLTSSSTSKHAWLTGSSTSGTAICSTTSHSSTTTLASRALLTSST